MIFIAIVDPSIGNSENLVKTHMKWCYEYANAHKEQFRQHVVTRIESPEAFIKSLQSVLYNKNYYNETIYLYYFCHGIRKDGVDYLRFGNNIFIRDSAVTEVYFRNCVRHLTVFYECCHSQGLYEPTERCYIDVPRILQNVNISCNSSSEKDIRYYKNNITVICTSLITEQSMAGFDIDGNIHTQITDILLTLKSIGLNENPFFNKISTVVDYVNTQLFVSMKGKQNMIVFSPNLLINWF